MSSVRVRDGGRARRSVVRLFGTHAAISLIPVLVLGGALLWNSRSEAHRRGLSEAQGQAKLVAETAIQPLLDGQPLTKPVSGAEQSALTNQLKRALTESNVSVRLLPTLDQNAAAAYASGGTFPTPAPDRANGQLQDTVAKDNSTVTVYYPLTATATGAEQAKRVGWLEFTMPYDSIKSHVDASVSGENRELAIGLGALYLTLIVISISMSRGLRKEVAFNAFLAEHDNLT